MNDFPKSWRTRKIAFVDETSCGAKSDPSGDGRMIEGGWGGLSGGAAAEARR